MANRPLCLRNHQRPLPHASNGMTTAVNRHATIHRARSGRTARARRHGFTLIELLVVIAIVLILSALLVPVFQQARAKARMSACTSNLKNFAIGMVSYRDDSDDAMTPWLSTIRPNQI